MSIFADQRNRLFRTGWTADQLAQELYSIFGEQDIVINGALTIKPNPDTPTNQVVPITIILPNGSSNTTTIQTIQNGITTTGGGSGAGVINILFPPDTTDDATLAPFPFVGQVVSGSGSSYSLTIYPYGTSGTGYTVSATQLQIDGSETINAGTWVIGAAFPYRSGQNTLARYYIQCPIWLSDL